LTHVDKAPRIGKDEPGVKINSQCPAQQPSTTTYMGDEVTKKDLQSLQGYCNKQIADMEKKLTKGLNDETAKLNKAIDEINKGFAELTKRINDLSADFTKRINDLVAVVNQHAKAINERD
jgi:archaellum component FlaC